MTRSGFSHRDLAIIKTVNLNFYYNYLVLFKHFKRFKNCICMLCSILFNILEITINSQCIYRSKTKTFILTVLQCSCWQYAYNTRYFQICVLVIQLNKFKIFYNKVLTKVKNSNKLRHRYVLTLL